MSALHRKADSIQHGCLGQFLANTGSHKSARRLCSKGAMSRFRWVKSLCPRNLFRKILSLIDDLRRRPVPAQVEENLGEEKAT